MTAPLGARRCLTELKVICRSRIYKHLAPGGAKTMRTNPQKLLALTLIFALSAMAIAQRRIRPEAQSFDIIIRGGTVYDGTGGPAVKADVGIKGDRVAAIGNLGRATAPT